MARTVTDRPTQALPGVNSGPFCEGCGHPFTPSRANQRHCRPSCRVLACRRRKAHPDREASHRLHVLDRRDPCDPGRPE
jgi:hypothetical protein